ncbi:hypothetical protein [Reichenbachiella sp.]|uniref:hypothetical protein n=1 Tax=Reichenbachiella sp. TaxID=2184521 RepID=UPI003BAE3A2D
MLDLRITTKYPEELIWKAKLEEWCAAHKITIEKSLEEPELHEGKKVVRGISSIESFLKEYKAFLDDWNDCRCDKWMAQSE